MSGSPNSGQAGKLATLQSAIATTHASFIASPSVATQNARNNAVYAYVAYQSFVFGNSPRPNYLDEGTTVNA